MTTYSPKTTLSSIAKLSGLSVSSVSRVINAPHLTSRQTQEKVNHAICKLDIEPKNIFRHRIGDCKSKKFLVIDNQLTSNTLINQGIEEEALQQGYKLLYLRFFCFSDDEFSQIIKLITYQQISGILIINNSPYLKKLLSYHRLLPPLILVNQLEFKFPSVYFDHLSIGYEATKYLIQQGHRRIAIVLNDAQKQSSYHFETGYQQAFNRYNLKVDKQFILDNGEDYKIFKYSLEQLLSLSRKPTAIICEDNIDLNCQEECSNPKDPAIYEYSRSSHLLLDSVISECMKWKIAIPKQISLFAISHAKHYPVHHYLNQLNCIYKPLYKMGKEAVLLLISILEHNNHRCRSVLVESELLSRQ